MFKDYWRGVEEAPKTNLLCLCEIEGGGVRKARYYKKEEVFLLNNRDILYNIKRWVPYPCDEKKDEIPVEVVYANLYENYRKDESTIKQLLKYIRGLHRYILSGKKNGEIIKGLEDMKGHKLSWDALDKVYDVIKQFK